MALGFEKEKLKIQEADKKSVKLSKEQKNEIRQMYLNGNYSQRQLAEMYKVSRRTIVFAIYPERYEKNREQFKERQKDGRYYDKEKHKEYMQKYREHKKELYLENKLI